MAVLPKILITLFFSSIFLVIFGGSSAIADHCPPGLVHTTDDTGAIVCAVSSLPSSPPSAEPSNPIFQIPNFSGFTNLGGLVDNLIQLAFFAAGLAFFIMLLIGGIQWITVGGDPKALQAVRARITNALIGLLIVVAAFSIAIIIQTVLGISIVSGFCFANCG